MWRELNIPELNSEKYTVILLKWYGDLINFELQFQCAFFHCDFLLDKFNIAVHVGLCIDLKEEQLFVQIETQNIAALN